MKRLIALTLGALMVVVLVAATHAQGQSDITFERRAQWLVLVDGDIVSWHDDRSDAQAASTSAVRASPDATVGYTRENIFIATRVGVPATSVPTPAPATPAPPVPTPTPVPATPAPPVPTPTPVPATPAPPVPVPTATEVPATSTPTSTSTPVPVTSTPTVTPTVPAADPVSDTELVWGYDATPLDAAWSKPELFQAYQDPAYGTTVTRVTSAAGTRFNRNTYSRRQAENADGTMFLTYHGSAAYHVYERSTGALVQALTMHPDAEPQWHPTSPTIVRHIQGPNSSVGDLALYETHVHTGATSEVADLRERVRAVLPAADYLKDRAEGSPSADGNRYAWLVYDESEQIIGMVSYDLAVDQVLGIASVASFPDAGRLDALSMSPTGSYVVAQFGGGTYVYDADLTNERWIFSGAEHSDIALGENGRDVYVYIDFTASATGGWLMAIDLDTLAPTQIFDLYDGANTSIHISGKGYEKPGWVVASTYSCKVDFAWSCFKVMAVELAPNGRVLNLAHTYNCGQSYWTETHAVVTRDFSRVYFNSDAGSCGIDAEVYVVDVPPFD